MTKLSHFVTPTLVLGVIVSHASGMRVCIEDHAGVGKPARDGLVRELEALLPGLELRIDSDGCNAIAGSEVRLTLIADRPGIPDDALGLAYRGNGSILPRLEVFVEPVVRLTNAADWGTVGRALARVAAHELLHYSRQSGEHEPHGLLQARLSAAELVSEELRPRLIASLHQD